MRNIGLIFKSWWLQPSNKYLCLFSSLILLVAVFSQTPQKIEAEDIETADTIIPADHVLIPIEISNQESLDSVIGPYGVIDLFSMGDLPSQKGTKVASDIRLIRAPLDPQQFAVLVHESIATHVVSIPGPYFVVIKNPLHSSAKIQVKKEKSPSRIKYFN